MTTEFRIIFTATFNDAESRDAFYDALKAQVGGAQTAMNTVMSGKVAVEGVVTGIKRADMTKDDYFIQAPATEQVI